MNTTRLNKLTLWDKHWDLNTGQMVRRFSAHGAQLAAVAVRPLSTNFIHNPYNTITAGSEFTVSMRGSRDDQQMNHAPSMPPPPPPPVGEDVGEVLVLLLGEPVPSLTVIEAEPLLEKPSTERIW